MARDRGAYMRAYQRVWKAARRSEWLAKNGPCATCGSSLSLQIDHVDPSTKIDHKIWSWSAPRREAELAKCQVLCERCHRAKTASENPKTDHGTRQMYDRHGCRCDLCRAKKSEHNAQQRQRRAVLNTLR